MTSRETAAAGGASGLLPGLSVIDAHVHLYDPTRTKYAWMADVPALNCRHAPSDYWADAEPLGVERAVWVEVNASPGEHLNEARLIAEWAEEDDRVAGMVASAPLDRGGDAARDIAALLDLPLVHALRTLIETRADRPGWALSEPFVSTLRATCTATGPAFDLCIRASQLGEVTELADRCPETRFVLDHCGKPGIGGPDVGRWKDDIAALAERRNVFCKLSGLATEVVEGPATAERVAPFLTHALDVFGPDRVMFASDWPICRHAMPLGDWFACVADVVAPHGDDAVASVFRDNARRFYRLPERKGDAA